ncbi:hypothetical protein OC834_007953, partial [Tilletia horrida]
SHNFTYASFTRFVLRAPSCDVHFSPALSDKDFLHNRMREVTELAIQAHAVVSCWPTWTFAYAILHCTPLVQMCDIGVLVPDEGHYLMDAVILSDISLPNLHELSLQIPDVDTHLLRALKAPALYILRLRCEEDIDYWPTCDLDHFPALFVVRIMCPGPSASRLEALGLRPESYRHNLSDLHNDLRHHTQEMVAYIKPYDRAKP